MIRKLTIFHNTYWKIKCNYYKCNGSFYYWQICIWRFRVRNIKTLARGNLIKFTQSATTTASQSVTFAHTIRRWLYFFFSFSSSTLLLLRYNGGVTFPTGACRARNETLRSETNSSNKYHKFISLFVYCDTLPRNKK